MVKNIYLTHFKNRSEVHLFDFKWINLFLPILCLLATAIGILSLYSASPNISSGTQDVIVGNWEPWAQKQMIRVAVAFIVMFVFSQVSMEAWLKASWVLYILCLFLLIGVELFGHVGKGAKRWLDIAGIRLQPSEPMRVCLILMLAYFYHKTTHSIKNHILYLLIAMVIIAIPTLLVLRQPDLGTAILMLSVGIVCMFMAGIDWKLFAGVGFAAILSIWPAWNWLLHDYQRARITAFINPESDPLDSGYQIIQSKIALGSGGWSGLGFGEGRHGDLNFVPEKQTDFIFALIGEEWGFVGASIVIVLYMLMCAQMIIMAISSNSVFARIVIVGVMVNFILYAFVNIAMVSGLIPVVGVPLPLISYGGTVLITLFASFGIVLSLHRSQ